LLRFAHSEREQEFLRRNTAPHRRGVFVFPLLKISLAALRNICRDSRVRFRETATGATVMPFSMTSYFLGVGTVVGALALGFGGGIVLTNTAIKETPTGPSRVERAARAEPVPSPVTEAKAFAVPRAEASQVEAAVEPKT
jgi:hypothetical protein